ncbi:hypothetical protein LDENG_00180730 [Lucifuga dentata]|nr:hypothetical protein LDENG_00180730 [Lucifuga dentata]
MDELDDVVLTTLREPQEDTKYPSKHEVNAMAKRLVEYYPMIKDRSSNSEWQEHIAKKLMKILSSVRRPRFLLRRNHGRMGKLIQML